MICTKGAFEVCPDCEKKWLVQPDTTTGEPMFSCFDTEQEARACYEQIERHNEYAGQRFRPRTAILLAPKEGQE